MCGRTTRLVKSFKLMKLINRIPFYRVCLNREMEKWVGQIKFTDSKLTNLTLRLQREIKGANMAALVISAKKYQCYVHFNLRLHSKFKHNFIQQTKCFDPCKQRDTKFLRSENICKRNEKCTRQRRYKGKFVHEVAIGVPVVLQETPKHL